MVCVPCIVIPVLLYIWHRFLQPIFLKIWNPWGKVEADKSAAPGTGDASLPPGHPSPGQEKSPGSCPFTSMTNGKTASPEELKKTE